MSKNRKIGEIFRERFEGASIDPPTDCWEEIEAALPAEKEKNRLLPFWIPAGGIAAALAVLFFLNTKNSFTEKNPVVETPMEEIPAETDSKSVEPRPSSVAENQYETAGPKESVHKGKEIEITVTGKNTKKESDKVASGEETKSKVVVLNITQQPVLLKKLSISQSSQGFAEVLPEEIKLSAKDDLKIAANIQSDSDPQIKESAGMSRFSISPRAGAVYSDQTGANQNAPAGDQLTMAYGLSIAYQVSDRIRLRTGIGKMNLNYTSREIDYFTAIDYGFKGDTGQLVPPNDRSDLEQELGYIEVPLEMEFELIGSRLGLNLIGGMSGFWLRENTMSLEMAGNVVEEGTADNLNDLSFSTNLGFGLNYGLSKTLEWNLEPIFKYRWNTYTNNNLRPYIFGIYSAVKFRF